MFPGNRELEYHVERNYCVYLEELTQNGHLDHIPVNF